jgi:glyoxylase-like metal-dependent hydrolase (beta-lactamase superfamily II)
MIFRPFLRFDTGCASYVLGCGGQGVAAVVDPRADDVDAYLAFAAEKGMRVTHVIDTHVHADHESGGPRLAARAGAVYALHRRAEVAHPFTPLSDGEEVALGNVRLRVIHTPGHTPDSIALLVTDERRGPEPWFVLTGDTLFSGAVGRPDLPGDARASAAALHASLTRLLALPDDLEVWPAHFAGSACGAGLSGKPCSTIGFERRNNPALRLDRDTFVESVCDVPPKPAAMDAHLRANRGCG